MKSLLKLTMKVILLLILLVVVLIGGRIILGLLLQERPPVLTPEEEALRARAQSLHHEAIVVDGHDDVLTYIFNDGYDLGMDGDELDDRSFFFYYGFPWLPNRPYGENVHADMDLARIQEGGLDAQFFAVYVDCSLYESGIPGQSRQRALDMIEVLQEQERHYPNDIEIAYTIQDVERIISEGKLAALIGLEGGHAIEERRLGNPGPFSRTGSALHDTYPYWQPQLGRFFRRREPARRIVRVRSQSRAGDEPPWNNCGCLPRL